MPGLGVGVAVGGGVLVGGKGVGVSVGGRSVGVSVGTGVSVGIGVSVGNGVGVSVGIGVSVGMGVGVSAAGGGVFVASLWTTATGAPPFGVFVAVAVGSGRLANPGTSQASKGMRIINITVNQVVREVGFWVTETGTSNVLGLCE